MRSWAVACLLVPLLVLPVLVIASSCPLSAQGEKKARRVGKKLTKLGKRVGRGAASGFRSVKGNIQHYLDSHDDGYLDDVEVTGFLRRIGIGSSRRTQVGRGDVESGHGFPATDYDGQWTWPLESGVVSSEYGRRDGGRHHGIDIAADRGASVYSAGDGAVVYSGSGMAGYGNVVIVRHDQNRTTLYAHNLRNLVEVGDDVWVGEEIAKLGSSGRSTGPHVHFEMRDEEHAVDPRAHLP